MHLLTVIFLICLTLLTSEAFAEQLSKAQKVQPLENYTLSHIVDMAQKGHPEAQMKLGFAFSTGAGGVPRDPERGFYWTLKAAEQGNAKAQYNAGLDYSKGIAVAKNSEKSEYWLKKAAAQGLPEAVKMFDMLEKSFVQDAIPFIEDLEDRASKGEAFAAYKLALIYRTGDGTPKDRIKMVIWLQKAAELGHAQAQFAMSDLMRYEGSILESFKWAKMAAESRHPSAQKNLALHYSVPDETPYDLKEAYAWMRVAIANGENYDSKFVEDIERSVTLFREDADELATEYIKKYSKK